MEKKELELAIGEAAPILSRVMNQSPPPDVAACLPPFDPYHCEYVRTIPLHYVSYHQDPAGKLTAYWKTHYFDLILN